MDHSDFVDANGTEWRIFDGLPPDYPDTGDRTVDGARAAGLTFRSSTGEVRVLPRAAIPRGVQVPEGAGAPGARRAAARVQSPAWQALLEHALRWPPR